MSGALILCGWKVDWICAVALVSRKNPDAEVVAISKAGLPKYLRQVAMENTRKYERIFILGVPLDQDERTLASALRKLRGEGVEVLWLSSYSVATPVSPSLSKVISVHRPKNDKPLCEFVAEYLRISRRTSLVSLLERAARFAETKKGDGNAEAVCLLVEAAMSRFRRFRDYDAVPKVVAKLAAGDFTLSPEDKRMIEEYGLYGHRELRGRSAAIDDIKRLAKLAGEDGECPVLITGETGTGKETVANLIHGHSPRRNKPFVVFNCADLSPQLVESKLFGHEKGAFTGADKARKGAFDLADGGTLFLDEVAELPSGVQAGLLRVLQESRFMRLGGSVETRVDVRILAATNRNLFKMVAEGLFREDLLYRLNVVHIRIPPLRDRIEDVAEIAAGYMFDRKRKALSSAQIEALKKYDWPGNVRELRNILDRAAVLKEGDFGKLLADHKRMFDWPSEDGEPAKLADFTRLKVRETLDACGGNKTRAAKTLGIAVNTLKKYLLPVPGD